MTKTEMLVTKRNGKQEAVKLDKVLARIEKQCYGLNLSYVIPFDVAKKVIDGIYNGVTTKELDTLAAETAAALAAKHPDYSVLAGRIVVSSLQKNTLKTFSKTTELLYNNINAENDEAAPLISKEYYDIVMEHAQELNSAIISSRDFNYDYFGFKTLEKSYLLKTFNPSTKKLMITETPQFMIMRVAVGIHGNDIEQVLKTYELMSQGFFTHATPTLFNAGTTRPQLASCFLLQMKNDSIEGIFDTAKQCAMISKNAGGIGVSLSNIRATGSYIKGTNGTSNGIVPMLKTFNEIAKYVDQCFDGESKILTNNGYVEIKNIKENDLVLTSGNTFNKVLNVKKYNKETTTLINIETKSGITKVTENHMILVIRNVDPTTESDILKKKILNGILPIEWIEAKHLTKTDKIVKY